MANFINPVKQQAAKDMFASGASIRAVMAQLNIAKWTAIRYRRCVEPPPCACGRTSGHRGWCHVRVAKSESRQAWLADMHAQQSANARPTYTCQFFLGFGFFWGSKPFTEQSRCVIKACPYPSRYGVGNYCRHHNGFYDAKAIMGRDLDNRDFYNDSNTSGTTNLRVVTAIEVSKGWAVRFWEEKADAAKDWLDEQDRLSFEPEEDFLMAVCDNCGIGKLTECPCPKCGSYANKEYIDSLPKWKRDKIRKARVTNEVKSEAITK